MKGIRAGFHTVTPYLIVDDGNAALEFYKRAFGAVEVSVMRDERTGQVRHGEIRIGNSVVMLTSESPEFAEWKGPKARGGSAVHMYLYVEDAEAVHAQALAAGAVEKAPVETKHYGDRTGHLEDPFGHTWYVATFLG